MIATKMELSHLLTAKGYHTKRIHYEKDDGTKSTFKAVEGLKLLIDADEDTTDT